MLLSCQISERDKFLSHLFYFLEHCSLKFLYTVIKYILITISTLISTLAEKYLIINIVGNYNAKTSNKYNDTFV